MRIGIIGAGPAGSLAAALFSRAGHEVTLFERKPGREKACGGGVTTRALTLCPGVESNVPHTSITELELRNDSRSVIVPLDTPLHIYARADCDGYLMSEAVAAGALLCTRNVRKLRPCGFGWEVDAEDQVWRFDWLIGADGARSCVRAACSKPFELADLSMTFGYYLSGKFHLHRAVVEFLPPGFEGYLWSFPRVDHSSVGVMHTATQPPTKILRQHVDRLVHRYYGLAPPGKDKIYGAMIPTLREATLQCNNCAGENWALIGDAGGFVDCITGEGIYFALRSARLLGQLACKKSLKEFDRLWREDFGEELIRSARLKRRFYCGAGWQPSYAQMLLPLTARSAAVRKLESDFVAGLQGYVGLRRRILKDSLRIIKELLFGSVAGRKSQVDA